LLKTLRTFVRFSLAVAILLISARSAPALSDDLPVVRVGIINSVLTMSPLFIGASKGYFHDQGLDIDFVPFDSATTMVVPLAQGRIDVAAGALSASFYNSVARGLNVRVVAALGNDPPGYGFEQLLVRTDLIKSGRYKTSKDLKGLRVAVNTLGASSTVALDLLLKEAGLTLADVTQVFLPFPQQVIAFQNGSIDVSVMAEPTASLTANTAAATRVLGADSWYPNQQIATLFYGSNFLRAHRDIGEKFMRGYIRAVRYYNDALQNGKMEGPTSDDVIRILTQRSAIHDPAVFREVTPNGVDVNGQLNLDSMRTDLNFYRAHGLIEGQVDVAGAVDGEFLAEALKNVGVDKRKR
jgi:NitT/TauT family transport system substrate-binding protein